MRETIDGVEEEYEFDTPIHFEPEIYEAETLSLLEKLRSLSDDVLAPLIVGHNPALHHLVLDLSSDDPEGRRQRIASKFPTAAVAVIELPLKKWTEIETNGGKIVELILPKELA